MLGSYKTKRLKELKKIKELQKNKNKLNNNFKKEDQNINREEVSKVITESLKEYTNWRTKEVNKYLILK